MCSSQHFGIVGNGAVEILEFSCQSMNLIYSAESKDGLFDLAWNEANEHQVYLACGDGHLRLFDVAYSQPVLSLPVHSSEIFGVSCNHKLPHLVSTASYDQLVKVTDIAQGKELAVMTGHVAEVYSAEWHPRK